MKQVTNNIQPLLREEAELRAKQYGSSVSCIILTHDNRILLQYRDSRFYRFANCVSTFGGGLEKNETAEQAVQREIHEELGAKMVLRDFIHLDTYTEAATNFTEVIYGYFWHDQSGLITGCFEGTPLYCRSYSEAMKLNNLMDDVPYLLNLCNDRSLIQ